MYLAKASPSVAGWNVFGPESSEVNVESDEPAAESAGDAPHDHIDRQLPYVVPESGTVQRDVVVVQTQVSSNAKSGIKDLAWPLVELCQEVQSCNSSACCQKPTPEQGSAVEGVALLNGEQQTTNRGSKGA